MFIKKIFVLSFAMASIFAGDTLFSVDFQDSKSGAFPDGWTSKDETNMVAVYSVASEEENNFLRADAKSISVTIGYDKSWNLEQYPKLKWRWRAISLPKGTDEKKKSGNDDVLGVYVVFGGFPIPRSIKYIWSETLPVGTELNSPYSSKTKMLVVRSGEKGVGEWVSEERDVLKDYRRLFGKPKANPVAKGIALLSDSDNTKTHVIGDYDDFIISK